MRRMVLAIPHDEESLRDEPTNQEMRSQGWVNELSTVSPAVDQGQTHSCQHFRLHLVSDMGLRLHPLSSVS